MSKIKGMLKIDGIESIDFGNVKLGDDVLEYEIFEQAVLTYLRFSPIHRLSELNMTDLLQDDFFEFVYRLEFTSYYDLPYRSEFV